jgi:isoleucyl-tRNA synthetase
VRKTLLTFWNTISFHALYASASQFELAQTPPKEKRTVLDHWILSELNVLITAVDKAYADFDSQTAGRELARFIDDLSNWYVRRSRRRFWDGDVAALGTLHECLVTLTKLLAPMVPFIAEHTWQELVRIANPAVETSVHLADFPIADATAINVALNEQVAMTRRVVELGRSARAESGIKIRQPLERALISAQGWAALPEEMKAQIADELNVNNLQDIAHADGDLVDISIKANFKSLGAKYGKAVQEVAQLIQAADAPSLVRQLRTEPSATIGSFKISLEDLVVTEVPRSGWMVASHDGESVALDLTLTPALIAAGNVREFIRIVQERRKSDGFDISDRIQLTWSAPKELIPTIESAASHICDEVLATSFTLDGSLQPESNELGVGISLTRA